MAIGTYPTDYASRTNLAILLKERGELEESLALLREATRLAPEEPSARFNLAGGLLEMGQFDEARAEIDRLLSVRDNGASRALLMALAVLRGDTALEAQQREWARSHDDPTDTLPMQLGAALYRGQFREAERLVGELQRVYNAAGVPTASAGQYAGTATSLAMAGAADRARAMMARLPGDGSADQTADERLVTAALIGDRAAAARALPIALENARADSESTTVLLRTMGRLAAGDLAGAMAALGDVQYQPRRLRSRAGPRHDGAASGAVGGRDPRLDLVRRQPPAPALGQSRRRDGRTGPGLRGGRPPRRRPRGLRGVPGVLEDGR